MNAHADLVQERLNEREALARMAAAMFTAPIVVSLVAVRTAACTGLSGSG